jgi:glycosyltransferase involved in cell wall biosynthesis
LRATAMRITFLIPTLNEVEGIRRTIGVLPIKELEALGHSAEVLVIDGASTDGTPDAARSLGARVINEPRLGYGRAYKTGLANAEGDIIVTGDADGTYPLEKTPTYLRLMREAGLDFVTLNRYGEMAPGAMSFKHRFGNRVLSTALRMTYGFRIQDSQSGMWIMTRQAVARLPLEALGDGMSFSQEIKIEAFRHPRIAAAELPGAYRPRIGEAKLNSWRDGLGNLKALRSFRKDHRIRWDGQT